ncbi:MAG: hypothetical protein Q4D32_08405 [Eubacteriales bacterium]|nr:hypothetical protein [Eubacteriales bacterium]
MNQKRMRRFLAVCLSVVLVTSQSVPAVQAAEPGTEKEEVVYAMLSGNGALEGAYVVNSFVDQDITDYGNYTNVKNLTTTDEIQYENGKISIHTNADKLYYQGDLDVEKTDLPWNIDIRYFMDGTEFSANEIAGMSGFLKIILSITRNESCEHSFWEGYALQAVMTLDSSVCQNIRAEEATIANVGSDKQLSYIILPGKGDTLEITADVKDFEMGEISINGMRLNLNINLDTEQLTDQLQDIKEAAEELDDGAGELDNGTNELEDGANGLEDGVNNLKGGVNTLNDGIKEVKNALEKLDNKSEDLTDGSATVLKNLKKIKKSLNKVNMDTENLKNLSTASSRIKTGINSLVSGLQTINGSIGDYYRALSQAGFSDVNTFVDQHKQAVAALGITDTGRKLVAAYTANGDHDVLQTLGELVKQGDADAVQLYQEYQTSGDGSVISAYVTEMGKRISIESLLKADISYIQGSSALISGIDTQLDSEKGALMRGVVSLQSSYNEFDNNIQELTTTLQTLVTNMNSLKTAINKLVKSYKKLDTGIGEYTAGVNKIVKGYQKLSKGSHNLVKGTSELYKGTNQLLEGVMELHTGTEDMQDGTGEFREKTKDIDSEMLEKVDDKIEEMIGAEIETGSFISKNNTKVDSVLFVMKTSAIEMQKLEETEEAEPEKTSVIQKFLKLFCFGK